MVVVIFILEIVAGILAFVFRSEVSIYAFCVFTRCVSVLWDIILSWRSELCSPLVWGMNLYSTGVIRGFVSLDVKMS